MGNEPNVGFICTLDPKDRSCRSQQASKPDPQKNRDRTAGPAIAAERR